MAANAQKTTVKKSAAAKKKAPVAKRKAPAVKKKAPAAKIKVSAREKTAPKKLVATKKAAMGKTNGAGKSDAGYSDKSAWNKKKPAAGKKRSEQPLMKALRAEHRHIATVMQLFADQLKAIESGELVDTHVVYEIMDYMVSWPDRYHHPREDLIYGRVAELDATAADEVDSLQRDHDRTAISGREVLQDIEHWREGEISGSVVATSGRAYIDHMYEHMNIEEKLVFPHIESVLTIQDWRELAEDDQIHAVADPVFGPRVQREFRNLTRKLRRNVRRGVERGTMVEWIGIEALMESMEVVSMAYESVRDTAGDHLRAALDEARDMFRESPLSAPFRCAANNARVTFRLLGDVADISRDTLDDLSRVNQERKDRVRLLDRESARR
jgi:hemerythrin-like domain-containing protein